MDQSLKQEWTLRENQFDWSIMSGELAIASVENKPSGLGICAAHKAALAAERQSREQSDKAWAETNEKLSALHKHDAEVREQATKAENKRMMEFWQGEREIQERKREPLVEALKFFRSVILSGESWTATCQKAYDDALAKVKEQ